MSKADNLPPSCAVVTKSGNLNHLETYAPNRACNGTALNFTSIYSTGHVYTHPSSMFTYSNVFTVYIKL